jgi:tetratricopeptide (TPR) repeat protein
MQQQLELRQQKLFWSTGCLQTIKVSGESSTQKFIIQYLIFWIDASRNRHLIIPFARNPHFVGRQEEIQKIEDLISAPDGPKKLAITGLGGVGKTQLVLELAYRIRDREPDCSIFWIPCTSHGSVEQTCMMIAQIVGIQDVEPAEVKERLKTYLTQTNKKWILIFDNADDIDMWVKGSPAAPPLKGIIPQSENGHVLFTSRNQQLALNLASPDVLSIPDVDQRTAREIFRKLLIQEDLLQDNYITSILLKQLAFLPLAISQAAAYINKNGISLARYMSLLGKHEESAIEMLAEEFEDDGRYAEILNPVATTWLISFLQIQQLNEDASNYLSFMACISPRDIPESILPLTTSAKKRLEALGVLKAYSFITAQVDDRFLSVHRLVHLATRNWLRKRELFETWIERTADQLNKIFPSEKHENRQIWRDYLPHALHLVDSAEFQAHQDNHKNFLAGVGSCLLSDGRYSEAETLFRDVLKVQERARGPAHPDTLTSVSQLGSVLARQGKYEEAEAMHRRDLVGSEEVLGPEHPDTLTSVSNLGSVLADQGKYEEAEAMHRQALQGYEKVLGPEHPDTLTSVSQLGSVLARQGKHEEAEAMHRQALQGREKVLGPEHPDTLTSVSQLGSVLAWQGKHEEAEAMHRRDLVGSEKVLGPEHPDTLTSVSQLGSVLARQGKYEEAEAMHRRDLVGSEKVLGPEHPDTLTSVSQLGSVLAQQGKYEEAEAMHRQALQGYEKVLGPEHPDTLTSVSQLGFVHARQGKYKEAEAMHRQALQGREKVLGPEHPDTLTSVSNLGSVLADQGKYEEAEAMHRQALQRREKVLGPEHPDTLTSVSQLGSVLARQGKYKEAEAMHRQALQGREKVLGPEHPDTLTSVSNLASVLARQGKYEEVEAMHRQALQGREKVLGPEHPHTLTSISQLASVLARQGMYEEAEAMHRQALRGFEKALGPEHPYTLTSMHNLAYTLKTLGDLSQALRLIKECADLRNKVLGSNHPHSISSFNAHSDWEAAANQLSESQQQASSDPPTLRPVQTYAGDRTTSALKPVGHKRRAFMNLFRRQ